MGLPITPGYGARAATTLKGNEHHQNIISHADRVTSRVTLAVAAAPYSSGQIVGSEASFAGVARHAGDSFLLEQVQVVLRGASVPADLELVIYADVLETQPANGAQLAMTDAEIALVQTVVAIPGGAFRRVAQHWMAEVDVHRYGRSAVEVSAVRGVLVARGNLTPSAADAVSLALNVRRD